MATIGAAIRSLRARVGLSQEELALLVGATQAEIARLEQYRSQIIRPELLVRLAWALRVPPAALLPKGGARTDVPSKLESSADVFRVGFWESVWTAPLIPVAAEPRPFLRVSSRLQVDPSDGVGGTGRRGDLGGRPLAPEELVRALSSAELVAIVVPREILRAHPDELTECAQIATAIDGVRVAVALNRGDTLADDLDGNAASAISAALANAAWERVRIASLTSPVRLYFPLDAASVETAHRVRDALDRRVELLGVAPENWPSFRNVAISEGTGGGAPLLAVAAEPQLKAWRRFVRESNLGLTTVALRSPEIWPDAPPMVTVLSLVFHRDTCAGWLAKPIVYEFLDAVERQAQEIRARSPRVLAAIAQRLRLDVPSVVRECARCDFTTRFSPSWVGRLRDESDSDSARSVARLVSSPKRST